MREDSEPAIRLGSLKTLEGVKLREKKRGRKKMKKGQKGNGSIGNNTKYKSECFE